MTTDPRAGARVVWALRRAFLAVEAEKEQRLRPSGLTPAHFAVLLHISYRPGLTGPELARTLGVSPQNVAHLAGRLQDRGLLERRANPHHAHVLELHLTPAGSAALTEADAAIGRLDADLTTLLGANDTAALRGLLGRVATGDLTGAATAPR